MQFNSFIVFVMICIMVVLALSIAFHTALGAYADDLYGFDESM
jgi:hypothetical protein